MQGTSERKRLIGDLEEWVVGRKLLKMSLELAEDDDDEVDVPAVLLQLVSTTRYLQRPEVPKSKHFVEYLLPALDDGRFRQEVRMSRESFEMVLSKIVGHKAFHLHGKTPQADPRLQLMVCAYRLGSSGSSASVGKTARHFGVSEGFVLLCTTRCIEALLSLERSEVNWPNKKERTTIKARILRDSGFPDCVGMLDGTLIPLEYKPTKDGEDYWSHKSRYGISAMVVCDDRRKIRYMFVRFCGSAHDMRVYSNSTMAKQVTKLFSPGEYLLADSAYTTSAHTIASYKKPAAGTMSVSNERFNFYHSSTRIKIEHTIGILKGRFPSLQSLRFKIHDKKTHRAAVEWIQACVVLHNMLLKDSFFDDNWTKYREPEVPEAGKNGTFVDGKGFRETIKDRVLNIRKPAR